MKDIVTFRFRSWALMPNAETWSPWNHCTRQTMMKFLNTVKQIDEASAVRLSPKYKQEYSALIEVQVLANEYDAWQWTPSSGWRRMPEDPRFANEPRGKGQRPPKKSAAQLKAERDAADAEIFGTVDDPATGNSLTDK